MSEPTCPVCKMAGDAHLIVGRHSRQTLMGYSEGQPDPNWRTTEYHCSRGHRFDIVRRHGGPDRIRVSGCGAGPCYDHPDDAVYQSSPYTPEEVAERIADNEACVQPETHIRRWAATVAALTAENERLRENEHTLRMGWWLSHGCSGLYGDDGEMQCGQCMIDFKRDDPRDIETRIRNANMLKLSLKLSRAALPSSRETTDGRTDPS